MGQIGMLRRTTTEIGQALGRAAARWERLVYRVLANNYKADDLAADIGHSLVDGAKVWAVMFGQDRGHQLAPAIHIVAPAIDMGAVKSATAFLARPREGGEVLTWTRELAFLGAAAAANPLSLDVSFVQVPNPFPPPANYSSPEQIKADVVAANAIPPAPSTGVYLGFISRANGDLAATVSVILT